ncbi:MAG: NADH-quinone oxidoreductase subunit J [candidate division NC10 bacterium]|nr:NADH-quinone oxidoreductase subunit J [candidate division NC10 bacterium]
MELGLFIVLALVAMASAIAVIIQRNPVYSALYLILTFLSLAGLYLQLQAQFIAAIQVIVYAGAIMVLFLFVIMLLDLRKEEQRAVKGGYQLLIGLLLAAILLGELGLVFGGGVLKGVPGEFSPEKVSALGNTQVVGRLLFTDFLLPFELTSVILLVAIVGAIVLAKRRLD